MILDFSCGLLASPKSSIAGRVSRVKSLRIPLLVSVSNTPDSPTNTASSRTSFSGKGLITSEPLPATQTRIASRPNSSGSSSRSPKPPPRTSTLSPHFTTSNVEVRLTTKFLGHVDNEKLDLPQNHTTEEIYGYIERTKNLVEKYCRPQLSTKEISLLQGSCIVSCRGGEHCNTVQDDPVVLESSADWENVESIVSGYEAQGHRKLKIEITRIMDLTERRMDKEIPKENVVTWLWKQLWLAVKTTGGEKKISYIAKDDLENLTRYDLISAIVQDPNADFAVPITDTEGRKRLADKLHHGAHTLLALVVSEKLSFKLLEHILANSTTDKVRLPLPGEIPGWLDDDTLRIQYRILAERQWPFQAAVFEHVGQEQYFDPNIIVPYISKEQFDHGAFSTLYRVRIEKSHQRLYRLPKDKNPELALKVMSRRRNMEKAFQNEQVVLKGLQNLNHDHIIKLLGTYRQEDNYHFLFPLADQNLGHYMAQDPLGFNMPESRKSKDALAWMWGQLEGIASGLCKIHVNSQKSETAKKPAEKAKSGTDQPIEPTFLDPDVERQNRPIGTGYHHDIKPENILHFSQNMIAETKTGEPAHGILQIADFGIGKFHSELSGTGTGTFRGTITYAAPESKVATRISGDNGQTSWRGLKVSRPYDVWSFGCVLMEVLVWMVFGKEGRDQFGTDRMGQAEEDDPTYMNDAFFYLKNLPREAYVRKSVIDWMEKLRNSHRIKSQPSGNLAHALRLVEEILNVDPIKRMSAKEVAKRLGVVANAARNEVDYGLETIKEVPSHDSTEPRPEAPPVIRVQTSEIVDAEISKAALTSSSSPESDSQRTTTFVNRSPQDVSSRKPPSTTGARDSPPGSPTPWSEGQSRTDSAATVKSSDSISSMVVEPVDSCSN